MVGLFKAFLPLLLATFAAAVDLQITVPSSSIWWIEGTQNRFAWLNPQGTDFEFTVLINNTKFASPLAFIAMQDSTALSVDITEEQEDQPAGTGYTIIFANPLNNTDVYAVSEQFEIKPVGSAYPITTTASSASGTGTGTSSPSASPTKSGAIDAHSPSFIGLVGVMALMAAGLLVA